MVKERKRILIFNVNWLGDVLFSTATIRNIKRYYPQSYLACIIPSRCYQVLKGNPYLDEIIIFDEKDRHKGILAHMNFVKALREKKFDIAFLLHRSFSRALICRLADIPERIGYYNVKRGFLLTKKINPPKKDSLHRIDYYLNIIEKAGIRVEDRFLDFFVSNDDEYFVGEFLNKQGVKKEDFLITLNPGGNWVLKRWPKEYWAKLADKLISDLSAKVVITGSQNDYSLVSSIKSLMLESPIIACGVFNIKQLAVLTKISSIFISADTGPLHIATAVGAKNIIAIFGPTSVDITGPYPNKNITMLQKDTGCIIPCYKLDCQDNRCMKEIRPEEVFEEIKKIKSQIK